MGLLFHVCNGRIAKKNINLDTKFPAIAKNIYHRSIIFKHTSKVGMHTLKSLGGLGFPSLCRHGMVEYFFISRVETSLDES